MVVVAAADWTKACCTVQAAACPSVAHHTAHTNQPAAAAGAPCSAQPPWPALTVGCWGPTWADAAAAACLSSAVTQQVGHTRDVEGTARGAVHTEQQHLGSIIRTILLDTHRRVVLQARDADSVGRREDCDSSGGRHPAAATWRGYGNNPGSSSGRGGSVGEQAMSVAAGYMSQHRCSYQQAQHAAVVAQHQQTLGAACRSCHGHTQAASRPTSSRLVADKLVAEDKGAVKVCSSWLGAAAADSSNGHRHTHIVSSHVTNM